jgi:hypothetical protein
MSRSYSSRLRGGGGGGGLDATTLLAAKVAFASFALAAAAGLARVVLPQIASSAAFFLWKHYLFITVHMVIFLIYKLSDYKNFHAAAQQLMDPWAPLPQHPARPEITEAMVMSVLKRKKVSRLEAVVSSSDEGEVSPRSCRGESPVTTESEEEPASSAVDASGNFTIADTSRSVEPAPVPVHKRYVFDHAPAPVHKRYVFDHAPMPVHKRYALEPVPAPARKPAVIIRAPAPAAKRAVVVSVPAPKLESAVVEHGLSLPRQPAAAATAEYFHNTDHDNDNGGGDNDLESTWNTIMQKKCPATAPASTPSEPALRSLPARPPRSPRIRIREPSMSAEELNRRADEFIKKIRSSFRQTQ